ncbi:SWIM zinc finger [Haloplanus vescus]|uniref:SWIM zinc finger n=1 Tax=Haloplanus vescus TaxID=555874 RepID=A0A1H3ZFJ4_9EURY|nr:SWIM zinc finger family protein [Haloplanus vescus]SEA22365.1 SWIM zinc finger [Haloplanus vescus]
MTHPEHTPASLPATRSKTTRPPADTTGRARRARTDPMAVRPLRDGRYAVETDGGTYVVDLDARSCTCPDAQIRDARCKHRRRVALDVTDGLVPPPGQRTAVCAVCGGRTFVPTGDDAPALCARHAIDPGTLVSDRETGDRLVVVAATGDRADSVATDEGRLVADYPSNADYGRHEPVFRAVYLDALRRGGDVTHYAFPASRLRPVTDRDAGPSPTDGIDAAGPTTA